MGEVVQLDCETKLDIPVEGVLDGAKELKTVLVLGYDANDDFYIASSTGDKTLMLWLIEQAKIALFNGS